MTNIPYAEVISELKYSEINFSKVLEHNL